MEDKPIVIIDYGLGNLGSIANMFKKVGCSAVISSNLNEIANAKKLVLPGVGAFDHGMHNLKEMGVIPILNKKVLDERTPILGLCLGMQLFTKQSEEGTSDGLGWIDAKTTRFVFDGDNKSLKIPHMGWNTLEVCQPHALFSDIEQDPRFYFVHSYYVTCFSSDAILAQTQYGFFFTSAVVKDNILGVQCHPEKSHKYGMKLFKNFWERI